MQKYNFMQKETWTRFVNKLIGMFAEKADKTEIPTALPNPQPITFSGTVPETTYDGSKAVNVVLPSAGVNYSLEERRIGTWIDGKPLYEKTVDFGKLPNATTKEVPHGVENIDTIWVYDGFSVLNSQANSLLVVPTNTWLYCNAFKNKITFATSSDRSMQSAFVVLRYTKTTD